MGNWSAALIGRLDAEEPELAKALGLVEGLEAAQFEEILGAFLQWASRRDAIDRAIHGSERS